SLGCTGRASSPKPEAGHSRRAHRGANLRPSSTRGETKEAPENLRGTCRVFSLHPVCRLRRTFGTPHIEQDRSARKRSCFRKQWSARDRCAAPAEKHLKNLRQLTDSGENAAACFFADGKQLIYETTHGGLECSQIFIMNIDGSGKHMVSTGKGRTASC